LIARNGIEKARYNLKAAQVTPVPDFDFNISLLKEYAVPPKQMVPTATIGFPLPIWDQNKGAIIAAESALVRATEEPHRATENLTNALASAYTGYKNNLEALEYYRRHILPDQVRAYRGVLARRNIDPSVAFSDLLGAQQTLSADVTAYLGILGSLWSSVVSVADLLQTDDLFQLAQPKGLPPLPDFEQLLQWPCCHKCPVNGAGSCPVPGPALLTPAAGASRTMSPSDIKTLPAPKETGAERRSDAAIDSRSLPEIQLERN
jgi:cobalt-zinc-cadmium efflux system outer membrane protein